MRSRVVRVVLVGLAWATVPALRAEAAHWAESLFAEQNHDFGPIARGAKARHSFVLTNRLAEPITIVNVRASCGCTTGRPSASSVAPGQSAIVEAEMDTRNFVDRKETTLFVTLATAGGREGEARLGVSAYILADIVLNPGTIDFGAVAKGQTPEKTLTLERLGAPGWQVVRMVSACRAIDARLDETERSARGVSYRLTVSLKPDAPAGPLRDEIRILTNDKENPGIPVQVTAQVRGELSATPAVLSLGKVSSAAGAQGRFLIRGSQPFAIVSTEGAGDGLQVAVDGASPKALHVLTVTYRPEAGTTRGDLHRTLRVHTSLPGEPPVELAVTLHVDP